MGKYQPHPAATYTRLARKMGVTGLALHRAGVPMGASPELAADLLSLEAEKNDAERTCPKCLQKTPADGNYCNQCGEPLSPEDPKSPKAEPPPPTRQAGAAVTNSAAWRNSSASSAQLEATRDALFGRREPPTGQPSMGITKSPAWLNSSSSPAQLEATHRALFGGLK